MRAFLGDVSLALHYVGYLFVAGAVGASLYLIAVFRWEELAVERVLRLKVSRRVIGLYILVLASMALISMGLLPQKWLPLQTVVSQLLVFLTLFVPFLALMTQGHKPLDFWNLRARHVSKYLALAFKVLLAVLIPLYGLSALSMLVCKNLYSLHELQPSIEAMQKSQSFKELASMVVFAVFIAPFLEEITFRGFLYPVLKAHGSKRSALWITSIFFALMHAHAPTFLPLLVFGAILTFVYERTGSLGYPIALHMLFNATSCCLLAVL